MFLFRYRLLGCGMVIAWRRSKYTTIDIKGMSIEKWQCVMKQKTIAAKTQEEFVDECSLSTSVHYASTSQTVTIECDDNHS